MLKTLRYSAEHHVLAIKVWCVAVGDEELRAVGVRASVGHGEQARASVLDNERLVVELFAVDALATSAIACREITALHHEIVDDAVERAAFEVQRLAGLPNSFFARAQGAEVFCSLRRNASIKLHLHAAKVPVTMAKIEEDLKNKVKARASELGGQVRIRHGLHRAGVKWRSDGRKGARTNCEMVYSAAPLILSVASGNRLVFLHSDQPARQTGATHAWLEEQRAGEHKFMHNAPSCWLDLWWDHREGWACCRTFHPSFS